ncbi:MAG TPA: hypothetical protein V6C52_00715 [Coleofasciculaceae cyanobacterium]|jgi:hypothetical protein
MKRAIATAPGEPTQHVDLTAEEIAARQVEENTPPPPLPLSEQLNAIFETLPAEIQADFAPLKAAVKLELDQKREHIARLIIQRATIPPELESLRQALLEAFNPA